MRKGKKEHLINLEGKIQAAMLAKKTDMTQDEIQDMLSEGKIQAAMMLRENKEGGGMLSREQYGAGAIVKNILNLRKGATKAPGRAAEEAKLQKQYDTLMKNHNEDLAKLDKIKDTGSEKQLKELKDKIRSDTEDLIMLEENLDALKNYSPGGRKREFTGGLLSDDSRQPYSLGQIVKKFIKQAEKNKEKAKKKETPESLLDDSTDMADRGTINMKDAIKMLDDGEEIKTIETLLEASGYTKKDIKGLIDVYRTDINIAKPNMTIEEIMEEYDRLGMAHGGGNLPNEGLEALHKKEPELVGRMMAQEGGSMDDQMMMVMSAEPMESDNSMEQNYTQFIMEEALTDDEEDMLVSKLEQDEELQMLFDKVIDVAQEFAGSGPVDGPGSGVSDSIPARLSDGEFVFTAKATEEIGEDKLMSMMKDAEAQADERQEMMHGGTPHMDKGEEQILSNVNRKQVVNTGTNVLEEDETSKNIKGNMYNPNIQDKYVRS